MFCYTECFMQCVIFLTVALKTITQSVIIPNVIVQSIILLVVNMMNVVLLCLYAVVSLF
jgi:hypothetical protein